MIDINKEIKRLVDYAVSKNLIDERDKGYGINRILDVLNLDTFIEPVGYIEDSQNNRSIDSVEDILENIRIWAVQNGKVDAESNVELDLLDTKIMAQLTKMPSVIEKEFKSLYNKSPRKATDYYYSLAKSTNYIREKRIDKDIKWKYESPYGTLDITINLSKPEKDPKAIAKAKTMKRNNYPKCPLCKENEGYSGRLNHPARGNHRIIKLNLAGEEWFLQYSPYVYYKEHCIVLKSEHEPMKITKKTFRRLLDFTKLFPHYFIGSNADLPIVGGSILTHDHFQGGNYTFAMAEAKEENHLRLEEYDIETCTLKWPMSVIRLKGDNIDNLVDVANEIFKKWKCYNDEKASIICETNGENHNTITPISRFRQGLYELDLVLRNNRTSRERPFGIFHPREELHHIKKENIGLIEVMGLAVLPARLKTEMESLKEYLLDSNINGIMNHKNLKKHGSWAVNILEEYSLNEDNIENILEEEIGRVFLEVLRDAGVFKDTDKGKEAFIRCRENLFSNMGEI